MSHAYKIVDATLEHVRLISATMRADDRAEIVALGQVPRHAVVSLWRNSVVSRAGFVDGDLAAVWGCAGALLSPVGEMWLVTSPAIERVPLAFAKEARAMIREMLKTKTVLQSACIDGYEKSLRLWRMLGFDVGEAVPVPPRGAMFRRLMMER